MVLDFLILPIVIISLLAVVFGVAIWTDRPNLSPAVEIGAMAVVALGGLAAVALVGQRLLQVGPPVKDAVEVTVIAHQWWWEFDYPKYGFKTANELHVPAGREVVLTLHSTNDFNPDTVHIVHGFWVRELGLNQPVPPGETQKLSFVPETAGKYAGRCSVYCGLSHQRMRFLVFVDPDGGFTRWVADQKGGPTPPREGPAAVGAGVFADSPCTTCHAIKGVSKGYIGPDLTHFGSRTTFAGSSLENTPGNVTHWLEDPSHMKVDVRMPSMGLRGGQLRDVVAYLESLK